MRRLVALCVLGTAAFSTSADEPQPIPAPPKIVTVPYCWQMFTGLLSDCAGHNYTDPILRQACANGAIEALKSCLSQAWPPPPPRPHQGQQRDDLNPLDLDNNGVVDVDDVPIAMNGYAAYPQYLVEWLQGWASYVAYVR